MPLNIGMCQDIRVAGPGVLWGSLPRASLVAQTIKNLPAMEETQVWSLSWEDLLEKGTATHSSILTQRIPWTEDPGGLQTTGSQRSRSDWAINTCLTHVIGQKVDGSCYKQPGACGLKGSQLQGFFFFLAWSSSWQALNHNVTPACFSSSSITDSSIHSKSLLSVSLCGAWGKWVKPGGHP